MIPIFFVWYVHYKLKTPHTLLIAEINPPHIWCALISPHPKGTFLHRACPRPVVRIQIAAPPAESGIIPHYHRRMIHAAVCEWQFERTVSAMVLIVRKHLPVIGLVAK